MVLLKFNFNLAGCFVQKEWQNFHLRSISVPLKFYSVNVSLEIKKLMNCVVAKIAYNLFLFKINICVFFVKYVKRTMLLPH
jgi:hypothetical protein